MAALLLAPAATLAALGVASWLADAAWGWRVAGILALLTALVLLGVSVGLRRSVALDAAAAADARSEAQLDEAILAAAGSDCGESCDACGVDDCAVKALPRR
jgi:hypothetical protein